MSIDADHIHNRINFLLSNRADKGLLLAELEGTDTSDLIRYLPSLASTGVTGAEIEALRDTIRALVEARLSSDLVHAVNALNDSTTRLTKLGWWVSALLAVAGIILPIILQILRR